MKTTFWRLFSNTAAMILFCLVLMAAGMYSINAQQLYRNKKEILLKDTQAVEKLLSGYDILNTSENDRMFRIALSYTSEFTDTNLLIADGEGTVIFCSCNQKDCPFLGSVVDEDILVHATDSKKHFDRGDMKQFFPNDQIFVCTPVFLTEDSSPGAFILAYTDNQALINQNVETTSYFLLTAFLVLSLAIITTSVIARNQTKAIEILAKTARDYGHGNFNARAELDPHSSTELQELSTAFNSMAEDLEKSEIRRREFVANVSHELKTPMTTIAGFMDGMLDGTIPENQHRQYMSIVSNEVRRLSRLVRNMLEISRIQSQGISEEKKTRFDICEVVGQRLLAFEQKINQKHLNVEVQFPDNGLAVYADQDSITQVVYNLIDNAVKFCNENGELYLEITSNGQKAFVSVANTGGTISPDELPLLFDRFHKADRSRNQDKDGVGLGLYIVKTIIDSHGENIQVTSRDGVTRFTFSLALR